MCTQSEMKEGHHQLPLPGQGGLRCGREVAEDCAHSGADQRRPVEGCMSLIAQKLDALRMKHFQLSAVTVLICFVSMQLFPLLMRTSPKGAPLRADEGAEPGVANGMLHLGSFATNFGAQLWVTFVAGLTMFYSLPRHMFGKVQSRLFPMFYLWSLVCSAVTLSTFLERHPYDTWDSSRSVQAVVLTICFFTAAFNSLVVSPVIVSAMLKTFQKEVDAGVGGVIGHTDAIELKKDPEYCVSYRKFRRYHGISAMLVVTSLVCNTVYLYHVTRTCALL